MEGDRRLTSFTSPKDLNQALTVAARINDDGEQTGLQPYEIRHLLDLVQAERRGINLAFRNMPYLGAMAFNASPLVNAERAVEVIQTVAENNGRIERAWIQQTNDLVAMRRILNG